MLNILLFTLVNSRALTPCHFAPHSHAARVSAPCVELLALITHNPDYAYDKLIGAPTRSVSTVRQFSFGFLNLSVHT